MEYGIVKPSNKLLVLTELDSNTWVSEVKRIRGKKQPLSSAGLHALRDEYIRSIELARARASETLRLERTLSDFVNQAYGLYDPRLARRKLRLDMPCADESMRFEDRTRTAASGMRRKAENGQNGRIAHCAAPIK